MGYLDELSKNLGVWSTSVWSKGLDIFSQYFKLSHTKPLNSHSIRRCYNVWLSSLLIRAHLHISITFRKVFSWAATCQDTGCALVPLDTELASYVIVWGFFCRKMEHVKVIVAAFIICGSESKKEQFTFTVVYVEKKRNIWLFSWHKFNILFRWWREKTCNKSSSC